MGKSLSGYAGYGFGVIDCEGTPEELEGFVDRWGPSYGLSEPLDVEWWGISEFWTPVIVVKRSVLEAYFGQPTPLLLPAVTEDEIAALVEARSAIEGLIRDDEDYDEHWSAKVTDIGWLTWAHHC